MQISIVLDHYLSSYFFEFACDQLRHICMDLTVVCASRLIDTIGIYRLI